MRAAVARVDQGQPITRVRTIDVVAAEATSRPRFRAVLVGTFAALALLLAMVGVFGVLAYSVQQRVREFGVRIAIGAGSSDVVRLVLGNAAKLTLIGLGIGLTAAALLSRYVTTLGVSRSTAGPGHFHCCFRSSSSSPPQSRWSSPRGVLRASIQSWRSGSSKGAVRTDRVAFGRCLYNERVRLETPTIMALAAGAALGTYHIVAFIGAGGMGEVYRARDVRLGREVALKILPDAFACDSDRLARFDREARVLASLNHPNIATIHGVEEAGDIKALVLEFVDGSTLAELIAKGPLPEAEAIAIGAQIAEAIEAAHAAGVVHRDLKPANIKVHTGRVKVLDFGLAKALDVDEARAPLSHSPTMTSPAATRHGVILGTAAYSAGTGTRRSGRRAGRHLGFRVRALRVADRPPAIRRTIRIRHHCGDPALGARMESVARKPASASSYAPRALSRKEQRPAVSHDRGRACRSAEGNGGSCGILSACGTAGKTLSIPWCWAAALVAVVAAIVGATMWSMSPERDLSLVRFRDVIPQNNFFTNAGHPLIAISPDATSVAYVAANRLFLRPQDRVEASPISGTEGSPTTPFFSPDGQFLGYFDFAQGELRRIPVAGDTGHARQGHECFRCALEHRRHHRLRCGHRRLENLRTRRRARGGRSDYRRRADAFSAASAGW